MHLVFPSFLFFLGVYMLGRGRGGGGGGGGGKKSSRECVHTDWRHAAKNFYSLSKQHINIIFVYFVVGQNTLSSVGHI